MRFYWGPVQTAPYSNETEENLSVLPELILPRYGKGAVWLRDSENK